MPVDDDQLGRPERKRQQRARLFIDAAKRIIADEGFEGLTMSRLASELDTVVSAVYRYFPSKGALVAEIQREGIEAMSASLVTGMQRCDRAIADAGLDERTGAVTRLVMLGRWWCATTETYPEELRVFQMIMSQRSSALDAEGGMRIFPIAMGMLGHVVGVVDSAVAAGVITPGTSLDRAVLWPSALSGVIQTDDLERYLPEMFGMTRLAKQTNLDLLAGWGADRGQLATASGFVDGLAADGPLAP